MAKKHGSYKMIWNYRIMKDTNGFSLREVFYENKEPVGWTEALTGYYETVEELIADHEMMLEDARKSIEILEESDLSFR